MSDEVSPSTTLGNSFAPKFFYIHNSKIALKLERNCLKQDKLPFTQRNVVKVLLHTWSRDLTAYFTLKYCLFGAVKITKNVDPDK